MSNDSTIAPYLNSGPIIDCEHPRVRALAASLAKGASGPEAVAERCFLFVRDEVRHSVDFSTGPVTCVASEVLEHRVGYCYAKSHLLAALLRASGIAAGLCYQRLSFGESGPPYCLHGLNAVMLPGQGWYRVDARGNKPGVEAAFCPPVERLAFAVRGPDERDLPGVFAEPLPQIVSLLAAGSSWEDIRDRLACGQGDAASEADG